MRKKFLSFILALSILISLCMVPEIQAKANSVTFTDTEPFEIENRDSFDNQLKRNVDKIKSGSISSFASKEPSTSTYFKFTLKEDAIVTLYFGLVKSDGWGSQNLDAAWDVFANEELTIPVMDQLKYDNTKSDTRRLFLVKGTYYVRCTGTDFGGYDVTHVVSFGVAYVDTKGDSDGFTVKVSKTETTSDNVVLTIQPNDPDAQIAIRQGNHDPYRWSKDHDIEGYTFTVTKNDKYTVRISDSVGNIKSQVITIDNIDNTRPTTPEANTYKSNTKKIVGKCDPGVAVTAKIGSKTYTAITRDNGVFTIVTPKLVKGNKIVLQSKDAAGNLSDKKTIKVN